MGLFEKRGESNKSSPSRSPSRTKDRLGGFRRTPKQEGERVGLFQRNKERKQGIFANFRNQRKELAREIEREKKLSKKPEYELSLELDTKKSPEVVEKQKAVLDSLSERQRKLFEKKGLVAGMYSLSADQRKQFEESGIAREFRGQAEEKMAAYFGYEGHKNIKYDELPKSMKRDMLLGDLYMDDFLPDSVRSELNADITAIKKLQQTTDPDRVSGAEREKIFETAKNLRNRYDIQPEDFQEYLREGGQDNGLLAGLFGPLLQSLAPTQLTELGVDDVQKFRQRNTPVIPSYSGGGGGGSGGGSSGGSESYSSDSYSDGGGSRGGGGSGGSSGFSTPSISTSATDIPPASILTSLPGDFKTNLGFWDASKVAEVRRNGGIWINMDCNQSDGRKVIPPLIVIPDDATPEMKAAAQAYVDAMAKLHNEKFGRDFRGQVKTRGQNGRGRANTIHTEAWSIDDLQMVDYLKSPEGIQEYRQILASTLGKIPGAVFSWPHGAKDPGAVNSRGDSEVNLAQLHLNGFSAAGQNPPAAEAVAETTPEAAETTTVVASSETSTETASSPATLTTEQATAYYGPQQS